MKREFIFLIYISCSREFILDMNQKGPFLEKNFFLFERKGFGRGDEFSSFLGQLGTQI